jgi:hypothetical protein
VSSVVLAEGDSMNSLSYRVKAKELRYDLGVEVGTPKYKTSEVNAATPTASNTDHASYENSKMRWTNNLSYGVSDLFSVDLGLNLSLKNSLKKTAESQGTIANTGSATADTGTTFSTLEEKNSGLEDIKLNSSYRYLTGDIKADLLVGIAYSGKSKRATRNKNAASNYVVSTGEAMSGGSSLHLGTQFAGVMGSFEWATGIGANYNMKKVSTKVGGDYKANAVADYDLKTKTALDLALDLAGQYNIDSAFSLAANLGLNFAAKREQTALTYEGPTTKKATTLKDDAHTDITLGLGAKYQAMTNVTLGLNYSHLFAADINGSRVEDTTTYTTHTTDRKDDRIGLDAAMRF